MTPDPQAGPDTTNAGCCCGNAPRQKDSHAQAERALLQEPDRTALQADTIWLPATRSHVGTDRPLIPADGEGPCRATDVAAFGLDSVVVTNRRFAVFVAATGYKTEAEQFGWSYVFHMFLRAPDRHPAPPGMPWWRGVEGAAWHSPEGPDSSTVGREEDPATHISWNDATAYALWAGGRLPTEKEWERAARGDLRDPRYPWGDDEPDDTSIFCNIWQGRFPLENTAADGWYSTAPARSFAPNSLGFYNMVGNVWEWCADAFRVQDASPVGEARDAAALSDAERTQKGGSYLCHASYCHRYRIASRAGRSPDTSAGHSGFRLAWDISARV